MYVYKTDFLIAQTTLQSSSMIVHVSALEKKKVTTPSPHLVLDSNLRRRGQRDSSLAVHVLRPILMQSDWEDRKGRFPIHYLFDGMCLDTFLVVYRIEFVVFVSFLLVRSFWGRLIRASRAGESQFQTASCPARGF